MKTRTALILILLLGSSQVLRSDLGSLPPDKASLLGEWIGCAYQGTEFYRLDVRSARRDSLVRMHPDGSCESYSIAAWGLKPGRLDLLNDQESGAEPIQANCSVVDRHYIKLEVRGDGKHWSRRVTLYKVDELGARLKITRKAAKNAAKKHVNGSDGRNSRSDK
jgi:hypothetical protein